MTTIIAIATVIFAVSAFVYLFIPEVKRINAVRISHLQCVCEEYCRNGGTESFGMVSERAMWDHIHAERSKNIVSNLIADAQWEEDIKTRTWDWEHSQVDVSCFNENGGFVWIKATVYSQELYNRAAVKGYYTIITLRRGGVDTIFAVPYKMNACQIVGYALHH